MDHLKALQGRPTIPALSKKEEGMGEGAVSSRMIGEERRERGWASPRGGVGSARMSMGESLGSISTGNLHFGIDRKEKRKTMPCVMTHSASQQIRGLLSPSHIAPPKRINFTYIPPPLLTSSATPLSQAPQLNRRPTQQIEEHTLRMIERRRRNRLCSGEFTFVYLPRSMNRISNCSFKDTRTRNHISFIQDQEGQGKGMAESKVASTMASRSSFRENPPNNDFLVSFSSRQCSSHCLKAPFPTVQRAPSAKLLTPCPSPYSFGGLFSRGLLCTSNLKQSIHCGPQIRMQRPRLQLLDRLGRQIKESTLSLAE